MKKVSTLFLVLLFITAVNAQGANETPEAPSYTAGGVPIVIPAPTEEMREVGPDIREYLELLIVAKGNRLLASFVSEDDLERLTRRDENLLLTKYASVQVPRRGEDTNVSEYMFEQIVELASVRIKEMMVSSLEEAAEELNRRMEAMNIDDLKTSFGQPIHLGRLFSSDRAFGYGTIIPVSVGNRTTNRCVGATLLLVKQRMLFVYLYTDYQNEESVNWIRSVGEKWVNAIIAANR